MQRRFRAKGREGDCRSGSGSGVAYLGYGPKGITTPLLNGMVPPLLTPITQRGFDNGPVAGPEQRCGRILPLVDAERRALATQDLR